MRNIYKTRFDEEKENNFILMRTIEVFLMVELEFKIDQMYGFKISNISKSKKINTFQVTTNWIYLFRCEMKELILGLNN